MNNAWDRAKQRELSELLQRGMRQKFEAFFKSLHRQDKSKAYTWGLEQASKLERWEDELFLLRQMLRLFPRENLLYCRLVAGFLREEAWQEARRWCTIGLKIHPQSVGLWLLRLRLSSHEDDEDGVVLSLMRLQACLGESHPLLIRARAQAETSRGEKLLLQGKREQALFLFRRATVADPNWPLPQQRMQSMLVVRNAPPHRRTRKTSSSHLQSLG